MDATRVIGQIREHINQHGLDATVERFAAELASWPGEPAGIWLRVSSGKQDEALQLPQVLRHCAERGYRPAKFYIVHSKSAFHGKHQGDLDQAVADMRHGEISVLVIWHSDRIERRPGKQLLDTLAEFTDTGGRVESVQEPTLGKLDFGGQVTTFVAGLVNWDKSKHISDQVKLSQDQTYANNATANRQPWGLVAFGPKYNKKLAATDECRKYAPKIFERCIDGDSCKTIAAWLDAEGVPTMTGKPWHEGTVRHIIKNAAYAGRRIRRPKKGEKNGTTFQTCPEAAVIDMDTWKRANDALANRDKRGPASPRTNPTKPMLAKLRCARCGAPMYRHRPPRQENYSYRCFGHAPQRRGCGNIVQLAETEKFIAAWMYLGNTKPYRTRTWVKGKNWDSEITDTVQSLHELNPVELGLDEYNRQHAELMTQLAGYQWKNEHEATKGGWEETEVLKDDGTVKLESEHFQELDTEGRREFLMDLDIMVEDGIALNGAKGARLVIDGQDYGVWPYIAV